MSWTEYGVRSTVILAIMIIGYILFTKLSGKKINWDKTAGVAVGHIIFMLLYGGFEKMLQWYLNG